MMAEKYSTERSAFSEYESHAVEEVILGNARIEGCDRTSGLADGSRRDGPGDPRSGQGLPQRQGCRVLP